MSGVFGTDDDWGRIVARRVVAPVVARVTTGIVERLVVGGGCVGVSHGAVAYLVRCLARTHRRRSKGISYGIENLEHHKVTLGQNGGGRRAYYLYVGRAGIVGGERRR